MVSAILISYARWLLTIQERSAISAFLQIVWLKKHLIFKIYISQVGFD